MKTVLMSILAMVLVVSLGGQLHATEGDPGMIPSHTHFWDEFSKYEKVNASLGKREFEKTEDWKKRIAAIDASLPNNQWFRLLHTGMRYDADKETLTIHLNGGKFPIVFAFQKEDTSTYTGSNAYGARRTITKRVRTTGRLHSIDSHEVERVILSLTPEQAELVQNKIIILARFSPSISEGENGQMKLTDYKEHRIEPTIRSLEDYTTIDLTLYGKLNEIRIANAVTNEILLSIPFN